MRVRVIQPDEHDVLGSITVDAYRNLGGDAALGSYEQELLAVAERARECVVLVAVDEAGELVGGVTYVPDANRAASEFTDPDAGGIRMLAVRPDRQGLGVGHALTAACIARARDDARRRVVLHSTPVMAVARGMYERFGFVRSPDLDVWADDEPSADEPLHLMAYVLTL